MKNLIKKITIVLLFVFTASLLFPFQSSMAKSTYDVELFHEMAIQANGESAFLYNTNLVSGEFEGRQSGTEGCQQAASYIASEFKKMGLTPYDQKQDTYFQTLRVPFFDILAPLTFRFTIRKEWITPLYREDFIVFPYSGSGTAFGKFVFVGYGVTQESAEYDDYEKVDVTNKTVVMFYQKPGFLSERNEEFSTVSRIKNAKEHHASAVIFIQQSHSVPIFPFEMKMATGKTVELPVLYANNHLSEKITSIHNKTTSNLEEVLEETEAPYSFEFSSEMEIAVHVVSETRNSNNVIGYIPAIDPESKESIVIGAHYDHLGVDHILHTVYQGANDNASGTACMLEVARAFMSQSVLPTLNIVFIAFTGEEEGLYGSQYYVDQPLFPIKKIKAMINMDMVGTGNGDLLAGTSSLRYPELSDIISESAEYLEQIVPIDSSLLYPGSDHYYFHQQKVPSVFFYKLNPTNIGGYHTLQDTIDSIDPDNLEKCTQLVSLVVLVFANVSVVDFSIFPDQQSFDHPFFVWESTAFNFINNDLTLTLQDKPIRIWSDDSMKLFCPLSNQQTELVFQVKFKETVVKEYKFTVFSTGEAYLRADFNQDNRVDVKDLVLLAKNIQKKSPPYEPMSLYDLSQNEIIDSADFSLFSDYFGSFSSHIP